MLFHKWSKWKTITYWVRFKYEPLDMRWKRLSNSKLPCIDISECLVCGKKKIKEYNYPVVNSFHTEYKYFPENIEECNNA